MDPLITPKPRKRFGQHFLHDNAILEHMVNAINPDNSETLVEIGPGQGALTLPLLARINSLTAIELDRDLILPLQRRTAGKGELHIHNQDVLKFDFKKIGDSQHPLRVVGNLPYNISTPLIFHLLDQASLVLDMHFLLQKEVVDRLAAAPGGASYGRLSVMVQYACQVEKLFEVPPEAFHPPPKVDSAFVRLVPYRQLPWPATDFKKFSSLVRQAFSQRRKTLRRSLKGIVSESQFEQAKIDPGLRPESLMTTDFVELSNTISESY